jgi:uncharacterized protein (DUF1697 family)
LAVVLTLNRQTYMSKALCRYVAFLRAVNGGQINTILKADLRSLFSETGAAWAEAYITSGNVVFDCLPAKLAGILERARDRLRQRHKIEQPIIVRKMADLGFYARLAPLLSADPIHRSDSDFSFNAG